MEFLKQSEAFKTTMLKLDEEIFNKYFEASQDPTLDKDVAKALHTAWELIVKFEIGVIEA